MRFRVSAVLAICMAIGLGACSKKQTASEPVIPRGFGVLEILVQDEDGRPIGHAAVEIINREGEAATMATDLEGRTKGAGEVSKGPFHVRVSEPGYGFQEIEGLVLAEGRTVSTTVVFKRQQKCVK